MQKERNVLIFVQINTHFKEMVRVAELLKGSEQFVPEILFTSAYQGISDDMNTCDAQGFKYISPEKFDRYFFKNRKVVTSKTHSFFYNMFRLKQRQSDNNTRLLKFLKEIFKKLSENFRYLFRPINNLQNYDLKNVVDATTPFLCKYVFVTIGSIIKIILIITSPAIRLVIQLFFWFGWYLFPKYLPSILKFIRMNSIKISTLFQKNKFDLIILPENNLYYLTPLFIKKARSFNIPVVIVPFTIVNELEWLESFYKEPCLQTSLIPNAFMSIVYPKWKRKYKQNVIIQNPQYILAMECLNVSPPIPWLINSGYSHALAAEGPFMNQYYQDAGIPSKQLITTGALYDDTIFNQQQVIYKRKKELQQELKLINDKPIILCALPPNQLHGTGRENCDFRNYEELIKFWLENLIVSDEYHVIISLHPRINQDEISFLQNYNISTWDIAELVPLSKIFIASCSATIRMAIACGIPVINYDVYKYGYSDYEIFHGVVTMQGKSEFIETVTQLIYDEEKYRKLAQIQQCSKVKHYIIDGKAGERMLELFEKLCYKQ